MIDTNTVLLPTSQTVLPEKYLGRGWINILRTTPGKLGQHLNIELSPVNHGENWSTGLNAELHFTFPSSETRCWYLVLNFRAPWRGYQVNEPLTVIVNGYTVDQFMVSSDVARQKLIEIPSEWIDELGVVDIVLETPDASPIQSEISDLDPSTKLGMEISAITLYEKQEDFLYSIQSAYKVAEKVRDELLDRKNQPMDDRGELVDRARRTLVSLEKSGRFNSIVKDKIEAFLNDPYVRTKHSYDFSFDQNYFHNNHAILREGHVVHEFQKWSQCLSSFHTLVVNAGNRAFLQIGSHKKLETIEEQDDPLLRLVDNLRFSSDKLQRLKKLNDRLNTLEALLQRDRLDSIPPGLEIEMASYCNYACVMCGRSWMTFHFNRQSNSELALLLPALPYINHVTIAGVGENTTSDRLLVLAKLLEKFEIESRIFTNGSMIHRQLDALGRFSKVCISFDGATSETFETQRRGANFDLVVKNAKKLRKHAPDIELAFSVVVSRFNIDELPQIISIASEIGVDHVAFSPVWHDSGMRLRPSDEERFNTGLRQAEHIANKHHLIIQNNVSKNDFYVAEDEPLNREQLLNEFSELSKPSNETPSMEVIVSLFEKFQFDYYPSSEVLPGSSWPEASKDIPPLPTLLSPSYDFEFDFDSAINKTESKIKELEVEIYAQPEGSIKIPYCLSVWKYTHTKANAKNQLCSYTNIDVGNVATDGFINVTNSARNRAFRRTMFEGNREPICAKCTDPYRRWSHESVMSACDEMQLDVQDLSNHSTCDDMQ